jgi:hypothetical protein
MKYICVIIISGILYLSCSPIRPCSDIYITPVFVGFSQSEVDSIILRAYVPNDSFNHLVDTAIVYTIPNGRDSISENITGTYTAINHFPVMYPNHDWEIYLPARGTSFFVSKIVSIQTTGRNRCINDITSLMLNGVLVHPTFIGYAEVADSPYPVGYVIFINNNP